MKVNLISAVLLFALAGCGKDKQSTDELVTINVNKDYPEKELILQDIMDVEYIALETTDEFITHGNVMDIGKKFIIVKNNNMPILCQFISPRYRATAYGIMNMTGVFAGAAITDILGKSTDAGNLGHDFAMLAGLVLIALLIQVIFLRPKVANMTDEC